MIKFYPRDIGMWRTSDDYDFRYRHETIHILIPSLLYDYKLFHDREELIEYFKKNGVNLTNPEHPLKFIGPEYNSTFGIVYTVVQWTVIGWVEEFVT